jgi:hypothetical protein
LRLGLGLGLGGEEIWLNGSAESPLSYDKTWGGVVRVRVRVKLRVRVETRFRVKVRERVRVREEWSGDMA